MIPLIQQQNEGRSYPLKIDSIKKNLRATISDNNDN